MIKGLCITFFNPSRRDIDNLLDISKCFDFVYVYDNTENNKQNLVFKDNKIHYFSPINNSGLSVAFNYCLDKAKNDNVDFLMFLDQDSRFDCKSITKMFEKAMIVRAKENFGMIGPIIDYQNGKHIELSDSLEKKPWIITSGSVLNVEASSNLKFDENYFINYIEPDFCYDLIKNGHLIYEYSGVVLYQELGQKYKALFKTINIHSPLRNYYGHRNRLYYALKHKNEFSLRVRLSYKLKSFKDYLTSLFILPEKRKNFRALKYAKRDFKKRIFGRCTYEQEF